MPRLSVAILGTPVSSGNRGVMALGASLVNLCVSISGAGESGVFLMLGNSNNRPVPFRIGGATKFIRLVNCRLSPRSRFAEHLAWICLGAFLYRIIKIRVFRAIISSITPWIRALEQADIVGDVRGGDSFSDIYGMRRFMEGFFIAWTVVLVKGSIVQFPQTFGPYYRPVARWLARYLLRRSSVIIARDAKSRHVAQELVGQGRDVWLSPDVAFSLEAIRPDSIELDPPIKGGEPQGAIGLNVNGLMFNGGYSRKNMFGLRLDYRKVLAALVKTLMAEHRGEIWLVPHTYGPPDSVESDPEACRKLRMALPEDFQRRLRIVSGEYNQHEIKGIIGMFDFFIGSRMHACIAALSQGVPCVGIAYSRKFEGVFDSVGMGDWVVDAREASEEQAVGRIIELYKKRDSVREELKTRAEQAQTELKAIFKRLISSAGDMREVFQSK